MVASTQGVTSEQIWNEVLLLAQLTLVGERTVELVAGPVGRKHTFQSRSKTFPTIALTEPKASRVE